MCKKFKFHDGFLSYLQDRTANSAYLAAIFCPVLVCPQKSIVGIKFLAHVVIKLTQKLLSNIAKTFCLFHQSRNISWFKGKSRSEIQRELKAKDKAVKNLLQLFSNEGYGRSSDKGLTDDEIEWCLYSMGDNSSFLLFNRDPVDRMISYLKKYFGSGASRYKPCPSGSGLRKLELDPVVAIFVEKCKCHQDP